MPSRPVETAPRSPHASMVPPCDLWQLRCCVTLAETLHFGRAAARLHMTQPPFSRQIALLESRLGVRLFERDRRSVSVTAAGRYFLTEARAILERLEYAAIDTRLVAEGQRGSVTVGYTFAGAVAVLPELVRRHRERFPAVAFVLRDLLIDEQLRLLGNGELDLAIVRRPLDRSRFDSCVVLRDRWVVALPEGHHLTARRRIPLAALEGEPMIDWSPISRLLHRQLEQIYDEAGVRPRPVLSMSMPGGILSMVSHGVGLALVPGVMQAQSPAGVVCRPLDCPLPSASPSHLEIVFAWRRDETNATVRALIETARGMAIDAPPVRTRAGRLSERAPASARGTPARAAGSA